MTRRKTPAKPDSPTIRCAIYTRKSSEEGLDQEFNSLDAHPTGSRVMLLPRPLNFPRKFWKSNTKAAPLAAGDMTGRVLRARFDAAQTTDENRRHWANADLLSPDAGTARRAR